MILHQRILYELGRLRVYHFIDPTTWTDKDTPSKIFWMDTASGHCYGPFGSIFEATQDFSNKHENQKSTTSLGQVIYVDFVAKRRIVFKVP